MIPLNRHSYLGDGDVKVDTVAQDNPGDEDNEDGKGSILKICHLNFHTTKLYSPAYGGIGGRRLESHGLPVCRLEVLGTREMGKMRWRK